MASTFTAKTVYSHTYSMQMHLHTLENAHTLSESHVQYSFKLRHAERE